MPFYSTVPKIFLEYQNGTTTMRYAPPSGSASKEAINEGSLSKIVNKPWTSEADKAIAETQKWREVLERKD